MSPTDTLDARIRELVADLVESAPPAPVLPELDWDHAGGFDPRTGATQGLRRRRVSLLVGVAATVVVAVLVVVLLLPAVGRRPPVAAAAELQQIAAIAASQASPRLGHGQWLSTEEQMSLSARVGQAGSAPTPEARATVRASIRQWSDAFGTTCISATSGPVQFASPADQAAWTAAGLLDNPMGQPTTDCVAVYGAFTRNSLAGGVGVIDVSSLPIDPSTLARELSTGTTGIAGLDELAPDQQQNPGFERATILMVGPVSGATPALTAALYQAMAMMPGIDMLGDMTTNAGTTGLGFAGDSAPGSSAIIVDPTTGAMLEARNVPTPVAFNGLVRSYLPPPPTPGLGTEGGGYGTTIQWFDPIGTPSVVGTSAIPADVGASVPTGTITTTARPGVTVSQLSALLNRLQTRYGALPSGGFVLAPKSFHPTEYVAFWSFTGPQSQVSDYAMALRASGLFSAVVVNDEGSS